VFLICNETYIICKFNDTVFGNLSNWNCRWG